MNHIYRVLWNAASGAWMAVSEIAHGKGKGSKSAAHHRSSGLFGALVLVPPFVLAQASSVVVAPGSNLNAYVAPNGVTVVNINAANAAGLSHNQYQSFNVNPSGLVLNNTTAAQIAWQSQLAGQVTANFNQANAARAILNEVVSNNRSKLAGFTEVLGGRADVVLANPYGITCSGCGFINTDRVTLTTGNPFLASNGGLGGFSVGQGDILITGTGLNATAQQVLDLVTRSVRVDAPVNGKDVSVVAGTSRWSHDTRAVTGVATATDGAPTYSIDTSALGGMYANRIRLTSTEAGAGVRMLGEAAASAGDFTLTAAGRVELRNRVSASSDVSVSTASTDVDALALTDASLTSTGKTTLAALGGVSMTGSALVAGTDLAVSAASLLDTASASGNANNNLRHAGGELTLAVSNGASLGATEWSANGAWKGHFGNLVTTGATRLYSGGGTLIASADQGDLALGLAMLQSGGNMSLSAAGKISTMTGAVVQTLRGNLRLTAGNGISNAGTMTADKGALSARANGEIDNSGRIHAAGSLDIADRFGKASVNLSNSGTLQTEQALTLQADKVRNSATARIQAQAGSTVNAANIDNAGAWLLSQQAGASDKLEVRGSFANNGTLQGAGSVTIEAGNVANSGTLIAAENLSTSTTGDSVNSGTVQAGGAIGMASGGAISNSGSGVLQAASLEFKAGNGLSNAGIATAQSGNATLRVDGTLNNSGQLHAKRNIDIADGSGTARQTVINSGKLLAEQALSLKAASFSNEATGWTQAATGSTVAVDSLDNAGTWLLSQSAGAKDQITVSGATNNSGTLQSAGDLDLSAASLINSGAMLAQGKLDATTAGDLRNADGGVMQAGAALTLTGAGVLSNAAAASLKGRTVQLDAASGLINAGAIEAGEGAVTLRVDGTLNNSGTVYAATDIDIAGRSGAWAQTVTNSGTLLAEGAFTLKAANMTNAATGHVQANTGTAVAVNSLDNQGAWLLSQQSGGAGRIAVSGTLTNSGTLQSAGDMIVGASQLNNSGELIAAHRFTANVTTGFSNSGATAVVQADRQLEVKGAGATLNTAGGSRMLGDGLDIRVASIDNGGTIQAGTRSDSKVSASGRLNNRAGGVIDAATSSAGAATVSAETVVNAGTIQSAGALTIGVGTGGLVSGGTVIAEGDLALQSRTANADYTVRVNGLMQSRSGTLVVNGTDHSALNIGTRGTVVGQRLAATLGTVALADGATLSSERDMTLSLGTLSTAGAKAAVLGSTDQSAPAGSPWHTRITTSRALINHGLLFSGNDLTLSAPSVVNGLTGGISALHDLSVTATSGNLTNQGTLYAGNALKASAESGTLTNAATLSAYQGAISAGKSVDLRADTLVNNSTIDSSGSITITARELRNEVVGGDTRVYGADSAKVKIETGHDDEYSFPNQHAYWYYSETWHKDQVYAGGTPTIKPQITGAGAVKLSFNIGKNLGGVISGDVVTFTGTGAGARFVNDDLALQSMAYKRTWTEHTKYIALGLATYYDRNVEKETTTHAASELSNLGAGVYARTLLGSNFALINNGSTAPVASMDKGDPKSADVKPRLGGDVVKATVGEVASGITGVRSAGIARITTRDARSAISFVSVNAANGVNGTSFGGINIPLPTNPNGLYVIVKEPNTRYLVENNPRYQIGSSTLGSDYLAERLGYDADTLGRRLGDSNYEAHLIKQQLIAQTGDALLAGVKDAAGQIKGLMDSAAGESTALGLVYGQALTPEQQSKLTRDIVWMVQTEVDGQVVLAPVVYLSQKTKAGIMQGAVITADTASLSLASLTNTGGTIAGAKSLSVRSTGDVRNTSGTIKGGNVAVTSTQGSVINQTASSGSGDDQRYVSDIGKTASIQSTGTLSLDAAKDIAVTGATVVAGGDARLKAGGNVTFDTLENKSTDTTHEVFRDGGTGEMTATAAAAQGKSGVAADDKQNGPTGRTTTTTTSIVQVKSGLTTNGNLSIDAGKDITLAGTDTKAAGNANLKAGGDLNIVARENSMVSHSESEVSGFGVNNSLFGSTKVTTDSKSVRNVGSTLEVGGDASLMAKKDVTIQGSDVEVEGDGQIKAGKNVNVLAGRDYDETRTTVERIGFLQGSASGSASANANAKVAPGNGASEGKLSAAGSIEAKASASGSAGLALMNKTKTQTEATDLRHVGSNLKFGGDLRVDASRDVNLQGSTMSAAGDVKVDALNVNLLAAEDKKTSTTQEESLSIGLMASSENTVQARASAEAGGGAANNTNPNGKVGVSGQVSASSENHIDVMQYTTSTESTSETSHKGSSITAGRDLSVKARQKLVLEAGQLNAQRDVDLDASQMEFKAVRDASEKKSSSSKTTAGLYVSANASASVEAGAGIGVGVQASATAQAQARVEVGVRASNTRTTSAEGSTTAVTSGISAGRNIKREARESITDVGTQIEAEGDLTQSAKTIKSLAAASTKYSSSSSASDTVKIGVYAEATANSSVGLTRSESSANAAAGVTASYKHEGTDSQEMSSQAVASNIKVGGNVRSTSTQKTELEGTTIDAKKDVSLQADALDYRAARNTSSKSENTTNVGGSVDVALVGGVGANISATYNGSEQVESSSKAVAGTINAGGNLSIRTKGDARYEGSNLNAGGKGDLVAGGKITFDAATNHEESRSRSVGVNAGISLGKSGNGVDLGVQVQTAKSSRDQEVGGSVKSATGPLNIQSGKDASFTGVTFDAGKNDVTIASAGDLSFKAAHDRKESLSVGASAGISGSSGKNKGASKFAGISKNNSETGAPNAAVNVESASSDTVTGTDIRSTGKVVLAAGKSASLENVQVVGSSDVQETAGGKLEKSTLQSTSDGFGVVGYAPEIRIPSKGGKGGAGAKSSSSESGDSPHPKAAAPLASHGPGQSEGTPAEKTTQHSQSTHERPEPAGEGPASSARNALPRRFNPPKDLGDGRFGYLLSPKKPVAVEKVGTLGADGSPSQSTASNAVQGSSIGDATPHLAQEMHAAGMPTPVAEGGLDRKSSARNALPRRFNPPKDLGDGRFGYLLGPKKPVAVEKVGTLGADGSPSQSTASNAAQGSSIGGATPHLAQEMHAAGMPTPVAEGGLDRKKNPKVAHSKSKGRTETNERLPKPLDAFSDVSVSPDVDPGMAKAHFEDLIQRLPLGMEGTANPRFVDSVRTQKLHLADSLLPAPTDQHATVWEKHRKNLLGSEVNSYLRSGVVPKGKTEQQLQADAKVFDELFQIRTSPFIHTSYRQQYDSGENFGTKIKAGDTIMDSGYLFTSVDTKNNDGFLERDGGSGAVYFRVDGKGSITPKGSKFGEIDYRPNTPMKVKALAKGKNGEGTFVWLAEQRVLPSGTLVKDIFTGDLRPVINYGTDTPFMRSPGDVPSASASGESGAAPVRLQTTIDMKKDASLQAEGRVAREDRAGPTFQSPQGSGQSPQGLSAEPGQAGGGREDRKARSERQAIAIDAVEREARRGVDLPADSE
ncbi:hemagglutinin repeat-containing protein [Verminephrobacter aporrectodeae]|uniref:hemagglutinin repeat-containing protein n=1 Tax=Verminephrobacter aporrectodeae TaxID=1110389 RepID=UPI002242C820|nr:hemagglutinin repeat-containing protein [Verminephrobacter aporrectodeae]MCW8176760.1 filamentous hemagglutinin N-terminal domain-containing protein [Verminephrobacter aporrectodeae subsp. tuberculatae]MCW8203386.1 filamentous hemagglutinin N-terminal domain-containing protein [Verminephrobacter aporrectodeae subsp. tuberculatae]